MKLMNQEASFCTSQFKSLVVLHPLEHGIINLLLLDIENQIIPQVVLQVEKLKRKRNSNWTFIGKIKIGETITLSAVERSFMIST